MLATEAPFPPYTDLDGKPLDAGLLYFGVVDQNPETNPITVYWDAAGTQPASQPILTLNGYSVRNGTPALVYVNGDYSLTVRNRRRKLVCYARNSAEFSNASILQAQINGLNSKFPAVVTSAYATFGDALAAAANGTLIINSAVVVSVDTDIPATTPIIVVKPGLITVNGPAVLTIRGSFEAGEFQVFTGSGTVKFHSSSRSKSPAIWFAALQGAVFNTQRLLVQNAGEPGGPVHAFEDNNTLNFTYPLAPNFNAYASIDANPTITGPGDYDHHVSFQARPTYNGSGSIWSRWDGLNVLLTHSGTGVVNAIRGVHIENPLGAGTINQLYGVFVQKLDRGADNYGFYSATTQNAISVGAGEAANWILRGNGQTGGFGLVLQSGTDSTARVLQTANMPLLFGTNNVVTGACTADGRWKLTNVGLTEIITASQRLEVQGVGGASFKATGGAGNGCALHWNSAAAGDNLFEAFYTEAAITQRGSIDYNRGGGQVRYNTTSDATLKNVFGDAPVAKSIEILEQTRLREYAWKDDESQKPQIGVIAQELHETFKGAVSVGGEYKEIIPAVTEQRLIKEGRPATADTPAQEAEFETVVVEPARVEKRYRPWAVDKTAFVWHLVAGFQHQQTRLAELEARVAEVERLLKDLRGQ